MCQLITLMDQQEIVESCLFLIPVSIQMTHIQLTSFQQDLLHVLLLFLSWWRWIPKTGKHHLQDQRLPGTISVDPPRQHPPMSGCWTVLRSLWSKISSCWPKLLVTKLSISWSWQRCWSLASLTQFWLPDWRKKFVPFNSAGIFWLWSLKGSPTPLSEIQLHFLELVAETACCVRGRPAQLFRSNLETTAVWLKQRKLESFAWFEFLLIQSRAKHQLQKCLSRKDTCCPHHTIASNCKWKVVRMTWILHGSWEMVHSESSFSS